MSSAKTGKGSTTRLEFAERLKDAESITHYLMTGSYDPVSGTYTLFDGSIGIALDVTPLPCSWRSDADMTEISNAIASSLSRCPENSIGQMMVVPTANIESELESYRASGGESNPVLESMEKRKIEFIRQSVRKSMFPVKAGEGAFRTRKFKIVITLVARPEAQVGSANSSLTDFIKDLGRLFKVKNQKNEDEETEGERRTRAEEEATENSHLGGVFEETPAERRYASVVTLLTARVTEGARRLEATLRNKRYTVEKMTPEVLIAITRTMLNPRSSAGVSQARWDQGRQIADQIPTTDVAILPALGSVYSDGVYHKVISLVENIRQTYPGQLTRPNPNLGWFSLVDYLGDGFICLCFHRIPKEHVRYYLERRLKAVMGGFAMAGKKEGLTKDIYLAQDWIENQGRAIFSVQMIASVWATDDTMAQETIERLSDKFTESGITTRVEQHYAPSAFFSALPFGWAPTIPEAKRSWLMGDRCLTDLAPIYGLSRGSKNGSFLVHNRFGELFKLDLFDSQTAPHFLIVGESGSGKSFFTNAMVADFLRTPNSQAFFIDRGKSYATLTSMVGGSYNPMSLQSKTVINVFEGTKKVAETFLVNFIDHLGSRKEDERLSREDAGLVEEAIGTAYASMQRTVTYKSFADILQSKDFSGKRVWVDQARKRIMIKALEQLKRSTIEQLRQSDVGFDVEFEIKNVAWLNSRLWKRKDTGEDVTEEYQDVRSVGPDSRRWLESRGFDLEDREDADGAIRVTVLYSSESMEQALENEGFRFRRDLEAQVLLVGRDEEMELLEQSGVEPLYPEEFLTACRVQAEKDILSDEKYKNADTVAKENLIQRSFADYRSPLGLFKWLSGTAVVQGEVTFSLFIECLKDLGNPRGDAIVSRLRPYFGSGSMAGFFDGQTGFKLEGTKIVCFEIGELNSAGEHTVASVVGALLQMILVYAQSPEGRPRRKLLCCDEFWALLGIRMVAETIINLYRTGRKMGMAVGVISQSISDFTENPAGLAILNQAQCRFLLRQSEQVVKTLDQTMKYTSEQKIMMATVHSIKGRYSECMIDFSNLGICEIVRLVPSPYFYWVATSAMEDVRPRDRLIAEYRGMGKPQLEAIDAALSELSTKYPNGMQVAGKRS